MLPTRDISARYTWAQSKGMGNINRQVETKRAKVATLISEKETLIQSL